MASPNSATTGKHQASSLPGTLPSPAILELGCQTRPLSNSLKLPATLLFYGTVSIAPITDVPYTLPYAKVHTIDTHYTFIQSEPITFKCLMAWATHHPR